MRAKGGVLLKAADKDVDYTTAEVSSILTYDVDILSSMVIRDLTLRSAASFGSFHLIRLLYDEYMYYLVEHRVAQAKVVTPIAVMGEVCVHTSSHSPTAAPASSWRCF